MLLDTTLVLLVSVPRKYLNVQILIYQVCTWTTYGTGHLSTNWSWRLPTILQCVPSLIVMCSIWFMPESPRWLFANNRREEGRAVLVRHHAGGNEDSAIVLLECNEIDESINLEIEGSDKRFWDYRGLFNTRSKLYRVFLLMLVSVFSQFIGGSVIRCVVYRPRLPSEEKFSKRNNF
jgi:hypothetical protein